MRVALPLLEYYALTDNLGKIPSDAGRTFSVGLEVTFKVRECARTDQRSNRFDFIGTSQISGWSSVEHRVSKENRELD